MRPHYMCDAVYEQLLFGFSHASTWENEWGSLFSIVPYLLILHSQLSVLMIGHFDMSLFHQSLLKNKFDTVLLNISYDCF